MADTIQHFIIARDLLKGYVKIGCHLDCCVTGMALQTALLG